ncbi:glucose-1-phosphate thymidylyltransferase [Marinilongibacter aquaticus]|uniref:putative sugar nucleotidyl transferase n=1 Tax=Marinilongibacter aquaticus TaxID=2975157 RepID=UPI0021BDBBF5|nr:putative sugar nucleotidyl transferase [Marinilongibacter aquaticus]UBM60641.1 glucose-1-phosphate thymidylyltransferase [Marinilongibacter aquaticus]
MNIILFEDSDFRKHLKPLTLTRPIGSLRVGILTIKEKWEKRLNAQVSFYTEGYLATKFAMVKTDDNYFVNSSFLPTDTLIGLIEKLEIGGVIVSGFEVVAYRGEEKLTSQELTRASKISELEPADSRTIKHLPDLFLNNGDEIREDFRYITAGRQSAGIADPHTRVYGENQIFVEEGVQIKAAIINAEDGPVYIGKDAIVQEGAIILGPSSIGPEAKVAYGAKIRNNVTLGPACRVGGEVGNTIFYASSNKAHDGFLGNSYIGEWCNLGANTNASNLKNDYGTVKLFDYLTDEMTSTGETFVGTFMGDYSKAGISTMFNTGSVVGVCCNVFGAGFQSKIIRSFSWGGAAEGYEPYRFEKAIEVINATMSRRNTQLTEEETEILMFIKGKQKDAV